MKKKFIVIITMIFIIAITSFTIAIIINNRKKGDNNDNNKYSKELTKIMNMNVSSGTIKKISYSCSGDMLGNIYDNVIDIESETLIVSEREVHNEPLTIKTYKVSKDDLNELKNIINKYNMIAWDNFPKENKYEVLDACYPKVSIEFYLPKLHKDKYIDLCTYQNLPDDALDIVLDLKKRITSLDQESNLIDTKELLDD